MGIPEWEEIAIPEGFGPHRLLYSPTSETVIAELRSTGEQFLPNQIFVRDKDAAKYQRVTDSDLMTSSESAVTALGSPLLFYLSNKLTKRDARFYGDFEGVYSHDLRKRMSTKFADKHSLQLPPPYVKGWVTGLLDVSAEGTELHLTVGMMGPEPSSGFRLVSYQLARMEVKTGRIELVCKLRGSFF